MLRQLFLFAVIAATLSAPPQPRTSAEMDAFARAFQKAGWKTEVINTSAGASLVVIDSSPKYLFNFFLRGERLARSPMMDPNIEPAYFVGDDVRDQFFYSGSPHDLVPLAERLGVHDEAFNKLVVDEARAVRPALRQFPRPSAPRKLSTTETNVLIDMLRDSGLARHEESDSTGDRVVNLPFDTKATLAWAYKGFAVLSLKAKDQGRAGHYPYVLSYSDGRMSVTAQSMEEAELLPFLPEFPDLKYLLTKSGTGAYWDLLEEDNGEAGLWFRQSLASEPIGSPWSPEERARTLNTLDTVSKSKKGIVFWKSGTRAVAQLYDDKHDLTFVEFTGNDVSAVLGLEDAKTSVRGTADPDLWRAYEGVCRQFGENDMILALFENKRFSGR